MGVLIVFLKGSKSKMGRGARVSFFYLETKSKKKIVVFFLGVGGGGGSRGGG